MKDLLSIHGTVISGLDKDCRKGYSPTSETRLIELFHVTSGRKYKFATVTSEWGIILKVIDDTSTQKKTEDSFHNNQLQCVPTEQSVR